MQGENPPTKQILKELAGALLSQHFHMQRAGGKKLKKIEWI